jgi:hypothetical protein
MGAPSISVPPVPVTPPPPALPDQGVQNAAKNEEQLAAMQYGAAGTILKKRSWEGESDKPWP